jgi:trans-aconitate 2-methyltransferase
MHWNVSDYERFSDERSRPFHDLVARFGKSGAMGKAASVVDLGCGTGELTATLCERFPEAVVLGVDNSPEMLAAAKARAIPGRLQFEAGDAGRFRASSPVDVLVSNAALQWVPDHEHLLPQLAASVAPGGILAVQMPSNFDAPSHRLLYETATEKPWADKLAGVLRQPPVRPLSFYAEMLLRLGFVVDAWETTYLHVLPGADPVIGWTRGTALRPVLDTLDPELADRFVARYADKLREAYPALAGDDLTLFPFRRIFFVARSRRPA